MSAGVPGIRKKPRPKSFTQVAFNPAVWGDLRGRWRVKDLADHLPHGALVERLGSIHAIAPAMKQPVIARQPMINKRDCMKGRSVLSFDGVDDILFGTFAVSAAAPGGDPNSTGMQGPSMSQTFIAICRWRQENVGAGYSALCDTATPSSRRAIFQYGPNSNDFWTIYQGDPLPLTTAPILRSASGMVVCGAWGGANALDSFVRVNGVQSALVNVRGLAPQNTLGSLSIGGSQTDQMFSKVDIAEILLYEGVLNTQGFLAIEKYARDEYGVPITISGV